MGTERVVRTAGGALPAWDAILEHARALGETPVARMIDGLPAFPGETPAADVRELRIGVDPDGMITLRRAGDTAIHCVTWGNAGPALVRSVDRVVRAIAAAADGPVTVDGQPFDPGGE